MILSDPGMTLGRGTRSLLIDDHPLFREGVGLLLAQFDPTIEIIALGTIHEAVIRRELVGTLSLIILDLELPDSQGYSGLECIRAEFPGIPVVILSAEQDPDRIMACIDRGAMGFVTKSSPTDVFRSAMRLIVNGGVYIPPEALRVLCRDRADPDELPALSQMLSPREIQMLETLIEGVSNKLIARRFGITEQTVKFHISNILKRLKVHNRTQAVIVAAQMGMRLSKMSSRSPQ